ncbi:hypothetical protein Nepgr_031495 [Nepenthes gracilis]|uniref:Uncharacterized protein n=1 Tax=Nepenthes gracilis TaxID=150966 RepID=A0AAD3Y4V7_NEPGR|nr:hypothetical protein Nepgr_031495 [Nepenthes gracilis]
MHWDVSSHTAILGIVGTVDAFTFGRESMQFGSYCFVKRLGIESDGWTWECPLAVHLTAFEACSCIPDSVVIAVDVESFSTRLVLASLEMAVLLTRWGLWNASASICNPLWLPMMGSGFSAGMADVPIESLNPEFSISDGGGSIGILSLGF